MRGNLDVLSVFSSRRLLRYCAVIITKAAIVARRQVKKLLSDKRPRMAIAAVGKAIVIELEKLPTTQEEAF